MPEYYENFEYKDLTEFISGHENRNKSMGFTDYVKWIEEAHIENFWKPKRLFLCGYIKYHCNKRNIPYPEFIIKFDGEKMDKLLFHHGIMLKSSFMSNVLEDSYYNAIPELLEYNIVVNELDNIY